MFEHEYKSFSTSKVVFALLWLIVFSNAIYDYLLYSKDKLSMSLAPKSPI